MTEEEVVVSKRPMDKEVVCIRKDVVDNTQMIEEYVRRGEIDVGGRDHPQPRHLK